MNAEDLQTKRLELDERRLAYEERQFANAQEKSIPEAFFKAHASEVLAATVALVGVLVSAANIGVAYIQKDRELASQAIQKEKELASQAIQKEKELELQRVAEEQRLQLARTEYEYKWKFDMQAFVDKHSIDIFGADAARQARVRDIMLVSFPPEDVNSLFESLVQTARTVEAKANWQDGQATVAALTPPRVYVRLRSEAQKESVKRIRDALVAADIAPGLVVMQPTVETVGPTSAILEYLRQSEEPEARKIADAIRAELSDIQIKYVASPGKTRPRHYELRFSPNK